MIIVHISYKECVGLSFKACKILITVSDHLCFVVLGIIGVLIVQVL